MNWLDIMLAVLLGVGFIKGLFDGFIKQVVSLVSLGIAIFFCGRVGDWLKGYLITMDFFPKDGIDIISTVLAFVLIVLVLSLTGVLVSKVVGATPLGPVDNFFGGLFGLVVLVLFSSLLLNLIEIIDKKEVMISKSVKQSSFLYEPVRSILPLIYPQNLFINDEVAKPQSVEV